ncbi:threonine synthase [Acetomicrobium thermoterrenum]|uniref:threonine synthase n=1 Tax=Acetomicrobium thermoterrenum TaxID=1120986 RepID=UPI000B83EBA2|nr:threonine synthase [Acetomicrobium thermoterrenum]
MIVASADKLKCVLCGREFDPKSDVFTCPDCGPDGTLDVLYDYGEVKRQFTPEALAGNKERSISRYIELLPINDPTFFPNLKVGSSPLYESAYWAKKLKVKQVLIKDDGRNPTASFKDRASFIGVAKAKEKGATSIACASTGNAASSLAGCAAVAGLDCYIFVPEKAPVNKVTQLLIYGAKVFLVKGTYEDAFKLAVKAIDAYGWYNRNSAINPYLVEGKKTCGLELAEELSFDLPDKVFVSVGDGCIISSFYKAFYDLKQIGLISQIPQLIGVQAEGANPIYKAFKEGKNVIEKKPTNTLADSIAVGEPRNWAKALRAVRNSGGDMVAVSDDEILEAMRLLARTSGVFGEPAGVTGFAGLLKYAQTGKLGSHERVAVIVTGNGLKDSESAKRAAGSPYEVEPTLEAVSRIIGSAN